MGVPQLPFELFQRIVRTAHYLERYDRLHSSRMWQSIRWFAGNGDVQQVPAAWAANGWFLQLVRAMLDPSVHAVHLAYSPPSYPYVIQTNSSCCYFKSRYRRSALLAASFKMPC